MQSDPQEVEPFPRTVPSVVRDTPDWPAWTAPVALVGALILAAFGALLIDIPAAILGVSINSSKLPGGLELANTVVQDAAFIAAAILMARVGGRSVNSWQFGLRQTPLWRAAGLVLLTLLGFFVFSAIWATVLDVSSRERILEDLGANEHVALLILSAALTTVIAPISEEVLFRGFAFSALRNWRGVLPAAILTGLLFGAFHLGSAPAVDLVPLAVLGFGLCLLYWRTNSLYPCIAAHSINNSIAYAELESWRVWQGLLLMTLALAAITGLAVLLRHLRVIAEPEAPVISEAA